ncbi:MAG: LptF/LptG family permease [Gemmatimonadaceae bacterium]|nr:LptF/LptG family permease [Gemmatimonadaceae bacterium]
MKVISRYVLREHLGPLVFSMSALTSLLLLNYIAKQLPQLVGKGLPWTVIAEFIVLAMPFTIAMTLPMAVLVATLHAFSRLAADSEITAFKASGLPMSRLMRPVVIAGFLLSVMMVWFNDRIMPAANYELQTLMNDIARKKPTFALKPQVINEVAPGRLFLRAGHLSSGSGDLKDVTIYDFSDASRRRTIRADSGTLALSPDSRDLLLTLYDGDVVELNRAEMSQLQRVFFTTNDVRVRGIGNQLERNGSVAEKSDRERTVCELQAQLQMAMQRRDSVRAALARIDAAAAAQFGGGGTTAGSGSAYCRMINWFRSWGDGAAGTAVVAKPTDPGVMPVESAQPREVAAAVPESAARHLKPAPMIAQDTAGSGARHDSAAASATAGHDSAAAAPPSAGNDTAAATPVARDALPAPSSGAAAGDEIQTPAPVLAEAMKIQLNSTQGLILGNQVEIEKKFAIATACLIFALLGAPIAFRFPRGGIGLTIGVSLGVFGVYYCGLLAGEELARRGYMPAYAAMWGTNFLLLAAGVYLTARLGSEGTTHRGSELSDRLARLRDRFRRRPRHALGG